MSGCNGGCEDDSITAAGFNDVIVGELIENVTAVVAKFPLASEDAILEDMEVRTEFIARAGTGGKAGLKFGPLSGD